jgi:hypothetical protein
MVAFHLCFAVAVGLLSSISAAPGQSPWPVTV